MAREEFKCDTTTGSTASSQPTELWILISTSYLGKILVLKRNLYNNNNNCRLFSTDELYDIDSDDTEQMLAGNCLKTDTDLLSAASTDLCMNIRRQRRKEREPWTCAELLVLYPEEWFEQLLGVSYETFCRLYVILKVTGL